MSHIVTARITSIDPNPFRGLAKYPFNKRKLETLKYSIESIGLFEGIIVRRAGNRYQQAFGHHRLEAAKQAGLKTVSLVVRDLTDEQMLQFMGRENLEDYNADFLVMLNTWEAGVQFLELDRAQNVQPFEIAQLLGFTRAQPAPRTDLRMNNTAEACHAAYSLIAGKHLSRNDLQGLAVHDVRLICTRTLEHMKQLEKAAKSRHSQITKRDVPSGQKAIATSAKVVADDVRKGRIPVTQAASKVTEELLESARTPKQKQTAFAIAGKHLVRSLERMLKDDATATKLNDLVPLVKHIQAPEDAEQLRLVEHYLGEIPRRATDFLNRLAKERRSAKVLPMEAPKQLEGKA